MPRNHSIQPGQIFGRLTAIADVGKTASGHTRWLFRCECGNVKTARIDHVLTGRTQACGCLRLERSIASNRRRGMAINPGDRFNRLVAISIAEPIGWNWQCDCGKIITTAVERVVTGHTKSCGCLYRDNFLTINITHGHTKSHGASKEYIAWKGIKSRCLNSKTDNFDYYGGRGIAMCDRWRDSFENFLADMGLAPSKGHSIDRKESNGDYCPENCHWATRAEQNTNRCSVHLMTFCGQTLSASGWARKLGIKPATVMIRIRRGWTVHKTLTTPVQGSRS